MWFSGFFFFHFVCHSWSVPMMKMTGLSHLFKWENLHNWWLTKYFFAPLYISPWHITLFMQQHTIHFWTHLVLCSLEQEGGVVVLRGQVLSSKSGILWIYGAFKTTGNSGKKNKIESWWHHWSSVHSSRKRPDLQFRVGWSFKMYFRSQSSFIPNFPVVLNSLSSFRSSEWTVVLCAHKSCFIDSMANIQCL